MNKGVALLLERQKLYPEEFLVGARWHSLLIEHGVPIIFDAQGRALRLNLVEDFKPLRPIVFSRVVQHYILTQEDLEYKGAGIPRAQLLKELLPGLNKLFQIEYARYGQEKKDAG